MQAPEYAFYRTGLIVLHKAYLQALSLKIPFRPDFKKATPAILKNLGLYLIKPLNRARPKNKGH
jgi:hypothetical protein